MIELRYSGGASNSVPADSLGGTKSSVEVASQTISYVPSQDIAGVTLLGGFGNREDTSGNSSLKLVIESGIKYLVFCPFGVTPDTRQAPDYPNMMTCLTDGVFALSYFTNLVSASIKFNLTVASLPGADQLAGLNAAKSFEGLFDSTTLAEATAGDLEYRCIYLHNSYPSSKTVALYTHQLPSSGEGIGIGFDPVGVNGTAQVIASESSAPVGVTFSTPRYVEDAITAIIPSGQHVPVWVRRALIPYQVTTVIRDSFALSVEATNP